MNKPIFLFAAFAGLMFSSCKHGCVGTNPTDFIPIDSANKMIGSYLNSIDVTHNDTDIQSLVIDMDQLMLYQDQTAQSQNRLTHIKLMFAHTLDYINSGHGNQPAGYNSKALTLIIAGYNQNGNYVYLNGNQVLDHSTPCPHNCPIGQASNSLLQ